MNKTIFSITLLSALSCSFSSYAADGTINFTGALIKDACIVEPAGINQTHNLGTVSSGAFGATGSTASVAPFNIRLSGCDTSVTKASVRFDGVRDTTDNRLLSVSGGATGVAIALYESNGTTLIPLNSVSMPIPTSDDGANLLFVAKYMSTVEADAITAGGANGVTQFTVNYN